MKRSYLATGLLAACITTTPLVAVAAWQDNLPAALTDADFYDMGAPDAAKVALGSALFWDKILSGNQNISCATCHHALTDTGDGLALPVGEGGRGLGVGRNTGKGANAIHERVPRNAPPVWNLGALSITRMFHDGRVAARPNAPGKFRTPAGSAFPSGIDNVLAAQAMFPVTSATEMAGQAGENAQADAAAGGDLPATWTIIADRLRAIPEYVTLFQAAYPDISSAADITFVHAANAIAAYEAEEFRADNSPFDKYLRGNPNAMSVQQKRGMAIFYGEGRCYVCHSGPLQTDMRFHAIAMPQIGPGKGDGLNGHDDFGREKVTGNINHRYRFRTPPLRNIALTAPYGHDGAYDTLEAVVRHHLSPVDALENYDTSQARLPSRSDLDAIDFEVYNDAGSRAAIAMSNELAPVSLTDHQVRLLVAFLRALTDPDSVDIRHTMPSRVPSGLTLAD